MSTLLTSPQPQCSASHISVILFQVSNYVPISTAVTEASLIEWDASWSRRTSFLQDLEGKRLSAFQNRGHLYPWTSPCVHLPCCHQSRSSRHEDRGGLPLASCTLIITKQLCLRSPGAQSYWWWSSLKSSGWLWAFKTLCVERILYGSITSYPTLSSSVHTAPAARSLPSVGVPWPLRFLGGSPVPGTLVCGCWTVPERALTLLPSLCSSSTGHSKKPFLPAEHRSPLWSSARCPATVLLILVSTYRLAIQLHCWIFCVLGLYFRTPQRWFWRNIWSWI